MGALEGHSEALQQPRAIAGGRGEHDPTGRWHGFVLTEIFQDDTMRPRMSHQPVIDGLEFAGAGSKLQGGWPVAEFLRLQDALRSNAGMLRYELRGVPEEQGRPA